MEKDIKKYDGKLTEEELQILREANFSDKKIEKIQFYLDKYKDSLTCFNDLVGDTGVPGKLFFHNIEKFGYLLENDPETVINKKDVLLRKYGTGHLIKTLAPLALHSHQVFENRNELMHNSSKPDSKIILPKEPVIWTPNHHFIDDALGSVTAAKRPAYFVFGSVPQFYNSIEGIASYIIGVLLINRNSTPSKQALLAKAKRAYELGIDLLWYIEGVWNKTPNQPLLDPWNGVYRSANETGEKIVPIVHYVYDPSQKIDRKLNPIHTVVDDPIDLTQFSEKAGLEYLREVMATWYYLMMEKYGQTTRENLLKYYENRAKETGFIDSSELEGRNITMNEAYELYLKDLTSYVNIYDSKAEKSSDFRPKDKARPEDVFANIANIKNITPENVQGVIRAQQLVRERKLEDFQRRF